MNGIDDVTIIIKIIYNTIIVYIIIYEVEKYIRVAIHNNNNNMYSAVVKPCKMLAHIRYRVRYLHERSSSELIAASGGVVYNNNIYIEPAAAFCVVDVFLFSLRAAKIYVRVIFPGHRFFFFSKAITHIVLRCIYNIIYTVLNVGSFVIVLYTVHNTGRGRGFFLYFYSFHSIRDAMLVAATVPRGRFTFVHSRWSDRDRDLRRLTVSIRDGQI